MSKEKDKKEIEIAVSTESATNFMLGAVRQILNEEKMEIAEFEQKVPTENVVDLIAAVQNKKIVSNRATPILKEMVKTGKPADVIIKEKGLEQISDKDKLKPIIQEVIKNNQKIVSDYKGGKKTAVKALVGLAMRATTGTANPKIVGEIIEEELN